MSSKFTSSIMPPEEDYSGVKYVTKEKFEMLLDLYHYEHGKDPHYVINFNYVKEIFSHIEGRLLTIVDASIFDKEQRNAIKSLVRQAVWEEFRSTSLLPVDKII